MDAGPHPLIHQLNRWQMRCYFRHACVATLPHSTLLLGRRVAMHKDDRWDNCRSHSWDWGSGSRDLEDDSI